ncbi:MAG: GNAT family N-acetyltransferase [Chloroflexota bacterium]
MSDITITLGFSDEHRAKAAALYYGAFHQKLAPIFRDDDKAIAVLQRALNPAYAIVSLEAGQLIGIAGFKDTDGSLIDLQPEMMTEAFGWLGGWVRIMGLLLFQRNLSDGVLLMDGIVVDASARGKGVGTKLLDAVVGHAVDNGYTHVRLDVVDTNPRAKQLYERKGFEAVDTQSYPYLKGIFGFSGVTTMLKQV